MIRSGNRLSASHCGYTDEALERDGRPSPRNRRRRGRGLSRSRTRVPDRWFRPGRRRGRVDPTDHLAWYAAG